MRYPPRLGHLATAKIVAAKLTPPYASAHLVDENEAVGRLERALPGPLLEDLLEATWKALEQKSKRFDEQKTLEKIFESLKDRPYRPGRKLASTPAISAFWILCDIATGTASDAARKVMESEAGQQKANEGLAELGGYLASELTR